MITKKNIVEIIDKWFKPLTEKDEVKNAARFGHKPLKTEWFISKMNGKHFSVDLIIDLDPDTCEISLYKICFDMAAGFSFIFIIIDPSTEEIKFVDDLPWNKLPASKEYSHELFEMLGEKLSFNVDYKICKTNPCKPFTYDPGENETGFYKRIVFSIELIMFDTDDFTYKISIAGIYNSYLIKTKRPINQKDFEEICRNIYRKYIRGGNE